MEFHDIPYISENLSNYISLQSKSKNNFDILWSIQSNIKRKSSLVIPFKNISTINCTQKEDLILNIESENKEEKILGISLDDAAQIAKSTQTLSVLLQLKSDAMYFIIDFLNKNKLINYLFLMRPQINGIFHSLNQFSRNNNYIGSNLLVKALFGLSDQRKLKKFRLIWVSTGVAMNEHFINEVEAISWNNLAILLVLALLRLNYVLTFVFYRKVFKHLNLLDKKKWSLKK
jgi:RNAse (barnase) inhibitor barstar